MEEVREGLFITLEGCEGAGKGTQVRMLYQHLTEDGYKAIATREPGATAIGCVIRDTLLSDKFEEITAKTELLLFNASRAQHVSEVIKPALLKGKLVLCDRYLDSTLAYQAFGRGLEFQEVLRISEWASGGLRPDLTILLDLPIEEAFNRIRTHRHLDRIEREDMDLHRRVADGFRELARMYSERIRVVDGTKPKAEIHKTITGIIKKLL